MGEEYKVSHITDLVGGFGRWQFLFGALSFFYIMVSSFNSIGYSFHSFNIEFWCDDVPLDYQVRHTSLIKYQILI